MFNAPVWWNGRHKGLKIPRWQQRTGSSPVTGTTSEGANTVPFPPCGENCTMLAPSSFSKSNPLRWASIWFFYLFSKSTDFGIGSRSTRPRSGDGGVSRLVPVGDSSPVTSTTSEGANTVPFPPCGENCTMLAPSSFSKSNPLRWASIWFFIYSQNRLILVLVIVRLGRAPATAASAA